MDGRPLPTQNGGRSMPHRASLSDYRPRAPSDAFNAPPPPGIGNNGQAADIPPRNGLTNSHMSRSPPGGAAGPNSKNTKHVPCKFYRSGQCTAGDACPYSHADVTQLEPCKFFLNGNCKYGQRCALPHISHGRILNPQCYNLNSGGNRGSRPSHSHNSYSSLQAGLNPSPYTYGTLHELPAMPIPNQVGMSQEFASPAGSTIGSPALESRLGLSPPLQGFSALDAPLPASYNSQDIPNIAKFGPNGSSVPAKSGWNPLTSSSPTTSMTTNFSNMSTLARLDARDIGTSPPTSRAYMGPPRSALVDAQASLSTNVSASLPVRQRQDGDALAKYQPSRALLGHADDDDDGKGEEFLPSSLSELLTDREKLRRFSRSEEDRPAGGRSSISSFGSPGSPSHASPSRFGTFFASQKKDKQDQTAHPGPSPFGHVGSPLRGSSTVVSAKPRDFSGSPSFGPISPPRSTDRSQFVSSLSEQIKGMRIGSTARTDSNEQQVQSAWKQVATPAPAGAVGGSKRDSRNGNSGHLGRDSKIEEEPYLFSMDDIKDDGMTETAKKVGEETPRRFADVAAMAAQSGHSA